MLWLGRILAILNLAAVAAFGYLAVEVYAKRTNWSRAVFATKLQRTGLPTNDQETDDEGAFVVDQIDAQMLQGLPNGVKTVAQAGEQLQARVNERLGEGASVEAQILALKPLLPTMEDRMRFQRLALRWRELEDLRRKQQLSPIEQQERVNVRRTVATALDERRSALQLELDRYKTPRAPAGKEDSMALRREVARLYVSMLELLARPKTDSASEQTSVDDARTALIIEMARVVGPKEAARALRRQAGISAELARFIERDVRRANLQDFLAEHGRTVDLAVTSAEQVKVALDHSRDKTVQVDKQGARTKGKVDELLLVAQPKLKAAREKTANALFDLQVELERLYKAQMARRKAVEDKQRTLEIVKRMEKDLEPVVVDLNKQHNQRKKERAELEEQVRKLRNQLQQR